MSIKNLARKAAAVGAVAGAIGGAGLLTAPAASADATSGNWRTECSDSRYWCVWIDASDRGGRYRFADANSSWSAWAIYREDSSSYNATSSAFVLKTWYGTSFCSSSGTYWSQHNPNDAGIGNGKKTSC